MTLSPGDAQRIRLYRMWRTTVILGALGAVEFIVLAWQRRNVFVGLVALPLIALAVYGARRARNLSRPR